jgi:hypothetical protein
LPSILQLCIDLCFLYAVEPSSNESEEDDAHREDKEPKRPSTRSRKTYLEFLNPDNEISPDEMKMIVQKNSRKRKPDKEAVQMKLPVSGKRRKSGEDLFFVLSFFVFFLLLFNRHLVFEQTNARVKTKVTLVKGINITKKVALNLRSICEEFTIRLQSKVGRLAS